MRCGSGGYTRARLLGTPNLHEGNPCWANKNRSGGMPQTTRGNGEKSFFFKKIELHESNKSRMHLG